MKIRSITCFYHPGDPDAEQHLARLSTFVEAARASFESAGYTVQTVRLATTPFPELLETLDAPTAVRFATGLEEKSRALGYDYLSIGPATPHHAASYALIPDILAETQNVFTSGVMAAALDGVRLSAVRACAEVIVRNATLTPDGFANLRFAATANLRPDGPFFPSAFHHDHMPSFALAMECADSAVEAFSQAETVAAARQGLLARLNAAGLELAAIARRLARRFHVRFSGIDFSPAPYPQDCCSLGGALEKLGVSSLGNLGSVSAAAILADTLDQGEWPRAGFNGLMLPVLEDSILAARATQGSLEVKDLLLFSCVCGTGLDTVPLPGSASAEQIAPVLLDVASLAVRLGKPLTARLMPIPGKEAGEETGFDFDYFCNGKIMALPAAPLQAPLTGFEQVRLRPRQPR
ncbi:MAG: DUF711 family protein [Chloroflexi bacterium]|nr:DUF711 family protein [Anaerolineaceae bacterium]NMB89121.1 DUF711 family protein [Chloroflexota bacterium]